MVAALSRTDADGAIYKVTAEPGEDDAYGAATKVGPMSKALIDKMMSDAEAATPGSGVRAAVKLAATPAVAFPVIPVMFDDDDESQLEPTQVHKHAHEQHARPSPVQIIFQTARVQTPPVQTARIQTPLPQKAPEAAPSPTPTPAASPQWLAAPQAVAPMTRSSDRDRDAVVALAIGATTFLGVTMLAMWWLFG